MLDLRGKGRMVRSIGFLLLAGLITACSNRNIQQTQATPGIPTVISEAQTEISGISDDQAVVVSEELEPTLTLVPNEKHSEYTSVQEKAAHSIGESSVEEQPVGEPSTEEPSTEEQSVEEPSVEKQSVEVLPTEEALLEEEDSDVTPPLQNTEKIFLGYIIDQDCFEDPGPEKDTLDCLLMESCRESGYGLAVKNGDHYVWYEFDEDGKEKAYNILKSTTRFKMISVTVDGTLDNNILAVSDMYENVD